MPFPPWERLNFFTSEVEPQLKKEYIYFRIQRRKLIAMPADLDASIRFLEETNDPKEAYFSYTVDDTGEFGLIKANKEGLRLYAAELLKKSKSLEETPQKMDPLFFTPNPWMCSETGYDLIAGVLPEHHSRREIVESRLPPRRSRKAHTMRPVLLFLLMCITGALLMLVSLKAFPTLRLWVNIH
jgi:hypothetical protein